jgi:hypothetical protein
MAPANAGAVRSDVLSDAAHEETVTTVDIKSEHLSGILPNGVPVDVNVKVTAQGADASTLTGEGRHFASTGAHSYWPAAGSTDGVTATLTGNVTESNVAFLLGSPVTVVGNASSGAITMNFGPLTGGPFAGQTLVFTGSGTVNIETR